MLIWTRSRDDWEADHKILSRDNVHKVQIIHIPCIYTEPLEIEWPPSMQTGVTSPNSIVLYDFAVVLSPNIVQWAARDPKLLAALKSVKKIYSHGRSTCEHLRKMGLPAVHVATVATAEELAPWLLRETAATSQCLWLTAQDPAFDLEKAFRAAGRPISRINCYKTHAGAKSSDGSELSQDFVRAFTQNTRGVIALASPSAVLGFSKIFSPHKNRLEQNLIAVVMGPTTAKAARPAFHRVEIAPSATISALSKLSLALVSQASPEAK